jgi:TetR/AcrR family transcriptional regulator
MVKLAATGRATRPSSDGTRERILAAALDLFSELSSDGATTREISARAGVTQPLLNYHFSSKDELWRAAVNGLFAELGRALDSRAEGLRGVDELTTAQLLLAPEYRRLAGIDPPAAEVVEAHADAVLALIYHR